VSKYSAIVTFGVLESCVDQIIQLIHGGVAEPARWFVFGSDAQLLNGLDQGWSEHLDLTLVLMPGDKSSMLDAATAILENEGQTLEECAWLHSELIEPPAEIRFSHAVAPTGGASAAASWLRDVAAAAS
jgi:hypothetical protein